MGQRVTRADIAVDTVGEVLDGAREYVRRQVAAFLRRLPDRVAAARLTLTAFARPSAPWPAVAQANLTVDGHPIRAQVAAAFFQEAGRVLRTRLREQAARLAHPDQPRRWPERVGARSRPMTGSAAFGQRKIVRYKHYSLGRCRPDEAALTMDVMDYDFHLFVDADTGSDSVIYRVGPTGYRLARLAGMAPPGTPVAVPLTIDVHPVPDLTPAQAVARLEETEMPFRFFRDTMTGRGAVLYRRYDDQYGLISPAGSAHTLPSTGSQPGTNEAQWP